MEASEDDRSLLFAISSALEESGYDVHRAYDVEGAPRLLQAEPFEVAVVAVRLGTVSGVDLLCSLKRRSPEVEVIVITVSAEFSRRGGVPARGRLRLRKQIHSAANGNARLPEAWERGVGRNVERARPGRFRQ